MRIGGSRRSGRAADRSPRCRNRPEWEVVPGLRYYYKHTVALGRRRQRTAESPCFLLTCHRANRKASGPRSIWRANHNHGSDGPWAEVRKWLVADGPRRPRHSESAVSRVSAGGWSGGTTAGVICLSLPEASGPRAAWPWPGGRLALALALRPNDTPLLSTCRAVIITHRIRVLRGSGHLRTLEPSPYPSKSAARSYWTLFIIRCLMPVLG